MSNHWNRNPFDSILPAEISDVKGVYPLDNRSASPPPEGHSMYAEGLKMAKRTASGRMNHPQHNDVRKFE